MTTPDVVKMLTHEGREWFLAEYVGNSATAALMDADGVEVSGPGYRRIEIRLTPPRWDGEHWEVANAEEFTFGPFRGTHRPHPPGVHRPRRHPRRDIPAHSEVIWACSAPIELQGGF